MSEIAVVFNTPPHGKATSREGLDALLALSAFYPTNNIGVYFLELGVLNLITDQQPQLILQKNYTPMFQLLELYEINNCYVCGNTMRHLKISKNDLVLKPKIIMRKRLMQQLTQAQKILTF